MAIESPEIQADGHPSAGDGPGGAILGLDLAELVEEEEVCEKNSHRMLICTATLPAPLLSPCHTDMLLSILSGAILAEGAMRRGRTV